MKEQQQQQGEVVDDDDDTTHGHTPACTPGQSGSDEHTPRPARSCIQNRCGAVTPLVRHRPRRCRVTTRTRALVAAVPPAATARAHGIPPRCHCLHHTVYPCQSTRTRAGMRGSTKRTSCPGGDFTHHGGVACVPAADTADFRAKADVGAHKWRRPCSQDEPQTAQGGTAQERRGQERRGQERTGEDRRGQHTHDGESSASCAAR